MFRLSCFFLLLLLPCVSCAEKAPISVVGSIRPLALLAQDLLGEWAVVDVVVPPHADPHNMSLKVSDRTKLDRADLVLWLGPEFERFLSGPMRQRKTAKDLAVEDIEGLFTSEGDKGAYTGLEHDDHGHDRHHEHEQHGRDLHVWLNPRYAGLILHALAERFVRLHPELAPNVQVRLQALIKAIDLASSEVHLQLAPYKGKRYGVYHDAYSHFGEAFDLLQAAAVNQMPEQRLSAKHLYQLQKSMKGVSCIVVERVSEKTERLAKVLAVKSVAVDPLASDAAIKTYSEFLHYLGDGFERCFTVGV